MCGKKSKTSFKMTKHMQIEKAFYDMVYHRFIMLLLAIITAGSETLLLFAFTGILLLIWIRIFCSAYSSSSIVSECFKCD